VTGTPSLQRMPDRLRDGAPRGVALPRSAQGAAGPYGVALSPIAARFDPLLRFTTWRDIGAKIERHSNATSWWLGDWLAFGQYKYGRRYKLAIGATGLGYQTLRNYTMVARRFDPSRRRSDVSFQHHAEVCSLADEQQDVLLDLAAAQGWSRNELRRRVRATLEPSTVVECTIRLSVKAERAQRWREAAELSDSRFEAWAVRVLDEASKLGGRPRPDQTE
jgi:hypothetical protein